MKNPPPPGNAEVIGRDQLRDSGSPEFPNPCTYTVQKSKAHSNGAHTGRAPPLGTEAAPLVAVGVAHTLEIVAGSGSDNDVNNLTIAVTAKQLIHQMFVVVWQNHSANSVLFEKFKADFTMVQSRIVAQECIAILPPMLARFLRQLQDADEAWSKALSPRREGLAHGRISLVWGVRLDGTRPLKTGPAIDLGTWLRDNTDRTLQLPVVVLMIRRQART